MWPALTAFLFRQIYCTVMEMGVECVSVPDVAVTLMLDVNAVKPPQPVAEKPKTPSASNIRKLKSFLRRRRPGVKKQNATMSPPAGTARNIAVDVDLASLAAVTVRVLVSEEPAGVREAGENAHVTPVGRPVQASVTAELNPLNGAMVTVAVPDEPCF